MTNGLCLRLIFSCSLIVVTLGCESDSQSARVPTGKSAVEGSIKLDGEPVDEARVIFMPMGLSADNETQPMAFGLTDTEGKFKLKTGADQTRIQAGDYRVIVTKNPLFLEREMKKSEIGSEDYESLITNLDVSTEEIPLLYNRYSDLKFTVTNSYVPLQAKFELTNADPLLQPAEKSAAQ